MKTRIGATKGIAIVITALALASVGRAQLQEPPKLGSYYSAKDYEWKPPWPFNPHPELPAVEFAPGKFLADDTGVPDTPEQAVARKRHAEAAALAKAIAADPVLAAAAHQAAEDARRRAEEAWQQKKVALAPQTRALIPPGRAASEEKRQEGEAEFAALRERATRSAAEQPAKERALDELSKRLGTPREIQESDGRKLILVDEIAGGPAYVGSHNTAAAASISADELWPLGAWPYSESNTGRNLTGTNVTLALWETDGGVRTNHIEFGTRVRQRDNAMLDTSGHATAVAGTLAAGGVRSIFGQFYQARGVVGGLGLVLQRRAQLYPGLTNAADAWLNSTLKAVAIDTVDEVGAEGPDYRLGHGIFNARRAVERVEQDFNWGRGSLIKEFTLAPTQSVSWVVTSSGTEPLSVTAAWSDPPGPAITNVTAADLPDPMLINNLDVVVEHLGTATISRPWVLNPDLTNKTAAARSAAATRGVDNRNNVERISIASPAAGEYRITVTHSGGLPGNPAPTTQKVSVVLDGATPPVPVITALEKSPTTNEFLLTFVADPGAYFTILASTNVATPLANWTAAVSVLSESRTNTVPLMSPAGVRFWRMRRGQ